MKVFIPAYFVTSGHSVQKWKGKGNEQKRCEETTACCYCGGHCGKGGDGSNRRNIERWNYGCALHKAAAAGSNERKYSVVRQIRCTSSMQIRCT